MKFQNELRHSKQVIREWVRVNFSDQKLASVVAFNADAKMTFRNPCGCLMGVTRSDHLHEGHGCNREHYWLARRQDLAQTRRFAALFPAYRVGKAEKAYMFLGFSATFSSCFGDCSATIISPPVLSNMSSPLGWNIGCSARSTPSGSTRFSTPKVTSI